MERLDHVMVGTQVAADPERLQYVEPMFELAHATMTPGEILFFHSNMLHRSSNNDSDHHRRIFIAVYNALSNPQADDDTAHACTMVSCPVSTEGEILECA